MEQCLYLVVRNAEVCRAAAAVYEQANANDVAAGSVNNVNNFTNGTAGSYDVFNDENTSTRFDAEAAGGGSFYLFHVP